MNEPMQRQRGFTLVELMISLVLGLLVTGALTGVLLANRQLYRQSESLARLQESARYAFEIMARDLREAGGIPCGNYLPLAIVLNGVTEHAWDGIKGFGGDDDNFPKVFGNRAGERVRHTDAVIVQKVSVIDGVYYLGMSGNNPAEFKVEVTIPDSIRVGDILMLCDIIQAAIFQVTNINQNNVIVHNTGTGSPGNCVKGLGVIPQGHTFPNHLLPSVCYSITTCGCFPQNEVNGLSYEFDINNTFISKLSTSGWYIGYNDRGGKSLYKISLQNSGGEAGVAVEEVAEGMTGLQIEYLTGNGGTLADKYVPANEISDWTSVVAARLTFTFQTLEKVGTNIQPIERKWYTVVSLRNRLP